MLYLSRKGSEAFSQVHWLAQLAYKSKGFYSGEKLDKLVWQDTAHGRFLVGTDCLSLFAVHESRLEELKEYAGFKVEKCSPSEVVLIPLDKDSDSVRFFPKFSSIYAEPCKRKWHLMGGEAEREDGHVVAAALLSTASIEGGQPKRAYRESRLEAAFRPFVSSEECDMRLVGDYGCVVFDTEEPGLYSAVMPICLAADICFNEGA